MADGISYVIILQSDSKQNEREVKIQEQSGSHKFFLQRESRVEEEVAISAHH